MPCHLANPASPDGILEIRSAPDFFVVKFIRRGMVSLQLGLHRSQTVICLTSLSFARCYDYGGVAPSAVIILAS